MNGTELKTALLRAPGGRVSQEELARRLSRPGSIHTRSMVSGWIENDLVPPEWVPLVLEALGIEPDEAPGRVGILERFTTTELLTELLDRERKRLGR